MNEYVEVRRIAYDCGDEGGQAVFVPVCEKCSRFVKANKTIQTKYDGLVDEPNAKCSKCGETKMLFEGFF